MPRFTRTIQDQKHLSTIAQTIQPFGIIEITLIDGQVFEGVIRRSSLGNNAGKGGWQYYGEVEIETLQGQRVVIDYLDIQSTKDVWSSKSKNYEDAGLISIMNP